jgi:hypothetical protein
MGIQGMDTLPRSESGLIFNTPLQNRVSLSILKISGSDPQIMEEKIEADLMVLVLFIYR